MTEERASEATLASLWQGMRPRQWTKNVLVAAVPLAAGSLFQAGYLLPTVAAFAAFCLAASGTYLINDARDVEADRAHPTKRFRPIAAGTLPIRTAVISALVLFAGAAGIGFGVSVRLGLVVCGYMAVTVAYSLRLKHEPVIELVLLSVGFLLRAIAGGAATGIPISAWFLTVAGFGSLFMAAGKRASELDAVRGRGGRGQNDTRRVLNGYTPGYLRFVWGMAGTVTIAAYCLWAFEIASSASAVPWAKISIVPFVLAILLYAEVIDAGEAGAPDEVVLTNRALLVAGGLWVAIFGMAAFGA